MKQMIRNSQQGFTKAKSCQTNLILFYNKRIFSVDMGRPANIVYTDFCKACDTVSHSLLLGKMARHRLDRWSARWVGNCLKGHIQRVVNNVFYSV